MPIQTVHPEPNLAIHPTDTLTVAVVIARVPGWTNQTKNYRTGLISALNTVTQMAGLPASSLPLTPASLRQHVLNRPAAAWGVKRNSRGNIRSRLRFILHRLDLIEPAALPLTDDQAPRAIISILDDGFRRGRATQLDGGKTERRGVRHRSPARRQSAPVRIGTELR